MRYYYQEIGRLWTVISILVTGKRRLQERVADAYDALAVSLSGDRLPEIMRARFDTLCGEYVEEGQKLTRHIKDYNWVAKNSMNYRRTSYFAKSFFEFCRDAIESAHQEMEEP
jgi:hypothetical protein